MYDIPACRGCLATGVKLESLSQVDRRIYNQVTGLQILPDDVFPTKFCVECRANLKKAVSFRRKCNRAHFVLQQIVKTKQQLLLEDIEKVSRKKHNLLPQCSNWVKNVGFYEVIKDEDVNSNPVMVKKESPVNAVTVILIDINTNSPKLELNEEDNFDSHDSEFTQALSEIWQDTETSIDSKNIDTNNIDTNNIDFENIFADLDDEADIKPNVKVIDGTEKQSSNILFHFNGLNVKKIVKILTSCKAIRLHVSELARVFKLKERNQIFKKAMNKCKLCYSVFVDTLALKQHSAVHQVDIDAKTACKICRFKFQTEEDIRLHNLTKHTYMYTCRKCNLTLPDFSEAYSHIQSMKHATANVYHCEKCPANFSYQIQFNQHRYTKHGLRPLLHHCFCGYVGLNQAMLFEHQLNEHRTFTYVKSNSGEYSCSCCDVLFETQSALDKHDMIMGHRTVSNGCTLCHEIFPDFDTYWEHTCEKKSKPEHELLPIKCLECPLWFFNYKWYFKHQKRDHKKKENKKDDNESENFSCVCAICGKEISSKLLTKHYKKHAFQRTYNLCDICDRPSETPCYLLRHKIGEHRAAAYKCVFCVQQFVNKHKAIIHVQKHRGAEVNILDVPSHTVDDSTNTDSNTSKTDGTTKDTDPPIPDVATNTKTEIRGIKYKNKRRINFKKPANYRSFDIFPVCPNVVHVYHKSFELEELINLVPMALFDYDRKFMRYLKDSEKQNYFKMVDEADIDVETAMKTEPRRKRRAKATQKVQEKTTIIVKKRKVDDKVKDNIEETASSPNINNVNYHLPVLDSPNIVHSLPVEVQKTVKVKKKVANVNYHTSLIEESKTNQAPEHDFFQIKFEADIAESSPNVIVEKPNKASKNKLNIHSNITIHVPTDEVNAAVSSIEVKEENVPETFVIAEDSIVLGEDGRHYVNIDGTMYIVENPVQAI